MTPVPSSFRVPAGTRLQRRIESRVESIRLRLLICRLILWLVDLSRALPNFPLNPEERSQEEIIVIVVSGLNVLVGLD